MDRVSWDWILNGLDEALDFCLALGLGRHPSRRGPRCRGDLLHPHRPPLTSC